MITTIKIKNDFITLGQLLKAAQIINNGGQAATFLSDHDVIVNNVREQRRGRKLYPQDKIQIAQTEILIGSSK